MKKINLWMLGVMVSLFSLSSCFNDLELSPIDKNTIDPGSFKGNPEYYYNYLAKLYAGLAVSGQEGPAGRPDIEGFDEGASQYLRAYWNLQELPTDEAVLGWNDAGLPELSTLKWSAANGFVYAMYSRIYFQLSQCNEFLRTTNAAALASFKLPTTLINDMPRMRAEARFLRALSYWHAIDLFGDVPFVTEMQAVGELPQQKSRTFIFNFILDELTAIEADIPTQIAYARASKASLWTLRAKVQLNAAVYTGTPLYTECAETCNKIITQYGSGTTHGLAPTYKYLFCGDNDQYARGGNNGEILFVVSYDSERTRSYGGTMYLTIGSYGGRISPRDYGVSDAWGGPRSTPDLVEKFDIGDQRYAFFDTDNTIENTDLSNYQNGFSVVKFNNLLSTDWSNSAGRSMPYPDTDYPLFRLADVYLMYAECALRGNGNTTLALTYMNYLRTRAQMPLYTTVGEVSLNDVLDERMRELYWEAHRRTDLIRFGLFTSGTYLWSWKGGVINGKAVDIKYLRYPIPAKEIAANPAIKQNFGF